MYETHLCFCAVCSFAENFVCMWDVMRGHCVRVFEEWRFALLTSTRPAFSVGRSGLVGCAAAALRFRSDRVPSPVTTAQFGHTAPVRSLYINNVGAVMATGSDDGLVRVWNL
jgi:WD40 repeat protein